MSTTDDIRLARETLPDDVARNLPSDPRPRILLLQGPVGPFMPALRRALAARGVKTCQIVFNLADLVFAGRDALGPDVKSYRGREDGWGAWFNTLAADFRPDIVVLFGCERPRHAIARQLCRAMGVPVLSLEEGYVRPGFVSAEWGGNNRLSPLASLPDDAIVQLAKRPAPVPIGGPEFNAMARWGFLYYVLRTLGQPLFRHAVHHKRRGLVSEAVFWVRSVQRKMTRYLRNRRIIDDLVEHHRGRFVVVPLQVRDDMQMVCAADGWTNERLIEEAIASFAQHAPADHRLCFKVHPLERGHSDAIARVRRTARRHGVGDRVVAVDDGSIGLLSSAAAGMITINSTSAFSALVRGVPLGVAGAAMYRREGLANPISDRSDLDVFWTKAQAPDPAFARAFRDAVRATALVPGDYYQDGNRAVLIDGIVARIEAGVAVVRERAQRRAAMARASKTGPVGAQVSREVARPGRTKRTVRPGRRKNVR